MLTHLPFLCPFGLPENSMLTNFEHPQEWSRGGVSGARFRVFDGPYTFAFN